MAILTLSREYGSGGREIGQAISKTLCYEYVDKEKLHADIRATGPKWEKWARDLDEHCPTVWERYDWSFRGFAALIQSAILNFVLKDNVVIMGRGANFLLKDISHAYRVRVQAPMDMRIERVMKRETLDRDTAKWLCEKTDSERACFLFAVYGKRWDDPAEYDEVFIAAGLEIDEIVRKVKEALSQHDLLRTSEAVKALEMRALAAKVKAGIATNQHFFIPTLEVASEGDSIVLRGVTHKPNEHKRIEDAARELAGGVPVQCKLHYRR